MDLVGRSDADEALLRQLGLHDLEIEDLLDDAVHPKSEAWNGHLLTVVHGLDLDYAQEQEEFEITTIEIDRGARRNTASAGRAPAGDRHARAGSAVRGGCGVPRRRAAVPRHR
ncbi:MAG: hypothetical protein ACRDYA_19190 [Egibacteraceae bacterium]